MTHKPRCFICYWIARSLVHSVVYLTFTLPWFLLLTALITYWLYATFELRLFAGHSLFYFVSCLSAGLAVGQLSVLAEQSVALMHYRVLYYFIARQLPQPKPAPSVSVTDHLQAEMLFDRSFGPPH